MDLYFDILKENEKNEKILDPNLGFVYKHQFSKDVLEINLERFGNEELHLYGLSSVSVPRFRRIGA